ncbi:MAG: phosphoribosylglycinamide formyltransferase [Deltaproteobacteria bacterium]|nr:phosphoribosylglycinamide formyltransferase [Deltaproteobacteria bacterium]
MKTGVLASGGGTNLQSLIDQWRKGALAPAELAVVGANVAGAQALERAAQAGIPTFVLSHKAFATREDFDRALAGELRGRGIELVVLAGFMRVLSPAFLDAFPNRVVNIHPALLPSFPGVHAQKQAFDYGVKVSGCTVHFVDAGTDTGPIIAQTAVPVLDGDDEESLRLRILAEEHRLLPAVVRAVAAGRVTIEGRRVRVAGGAL